jgi:general secretion pathway protein K
VTIGFESAMTARRSTASFSMEQGLQLAQGAEALAAWVLDEDDEKEDTPSERWSQPYVPVEVAPEVTLEAQLYDEQGKFNVNTLLDQNGEIDKNAQEIFDRLLELLDLEPRWSSLLVDWLDKNDQPETDGGEDSLYLSQTPPYRPLNMPITSVSEIAQLPGLGNERYLKLLPHITALPRSAATINVCTAGQRVLDALFALSSNSSNKKTLQYSLLSDEDLAKSRDKGCFPVPDSYGTTSAEPQLRSRIDVKSEYFQLRTWLRVGFTEFALYSLMYRENGAEVRPIVRTFGTE